MDVLQWGPLPSENDKGGVEYYIQRLSNELVSRDINVDICTFGFGDQGKSVQTHLLPPFKKYDIIHTHLGLKSLGILSILRKIVTDEALIFTVHIVPNPRTENVKVLKQSLIHWTGFYFNKILAKASDDVTAVSDYSSSEASEHFSVEPTVVPNGVDTTEFRPMDYDTARQEVRRELDLQIDPDERVLFYFGQLLERKGVDTLISAFSELPRDYSDVRLVIGGDGYYKEKLKELAADRGVRKEVEFLGIVPDEVVVPLYNIADIYCIPTRGMEGMPTTALEAMATGTPIVCSPIGGLQEIIQHKETGLFVDRDSSSVSKGLLTLLNNRKMADEIGAASREYACNEHDWSRIAEKYLNIYSKL